MIVTRNPSWERCRSTLASTERVSIILSTVCVLQATILYHTSAGNKFELARATLLVSLPMRTREVCILHVINFLE